jgi:hypothetical protein
MNRDKSERDLTFKTPYQKRKENFFKVTFRKYKKTA